MKDINLEFDLIEQAKLNNEQAYEQLCKKYQYMIIKIISQLCYKFNYMKGYKDDLLQEGYIMISKAVNTYKGDKNCRFSTYLYIIIQRHFYRLSKEYYKVYNNELLYPNNIVEETSNEYVTSDKYNPAFILDQSIRTKSILNAYQSLDNQEKLLLKCRLNKMSYKQISSFLNINIRQVEYQLKKTKIKLANKIQKNNDIINI